MAEKVTIARPYAKAAFEYAREHGAFARWSEVLGAASTIVVDPQVTGLLANPRVTPSQLVDLIAGILGDTLDEHGKNFLNTLAQNRRLSLLPEIAAIYETLRADIEQIADVHVTSAMALTDEQRNRLAAALKKRLRREVRLHERAHSWHTTLVGGAVVRSGDLVVDGSLRAGLERLATELTH